MFKRLENFFLKRIIKRIKNEIPELKVTILEEFEEHKDELLDFVKKKLKQAIKDFVVAKINSET